jgi:hypothetical protein
MPSTVTSEAATIRVRARFQCGFGRAGAGTTITMFLPGPMSRTALRFQKGAISTSLSATGSSTGGQRMIRRGTCRRNRLLAHPKLACRCLSTRCRVERADGDIVSVRITERKLHSSSAGIHMWLFFELGDESACCWQRHVKVVDPEEQEETLPGIAWWGLVNGGCL